MKLFNQIRPAAKKIISTLTIIAFTVCTTFAQNAADSDGSNDADSNSGRNHLGLYLFIVLLLVFTVITAYFTKNKQKTPEN